jgi:hypothetical protein
MIITMQKPSHALLFLLILLTIAQSQSCSGAAFFNGQRCVPCAANCQCSQENGCDSCLSGYTHDALFENCLQCPTATDSVNVGCDQCCYQVQGPGFVCSSCPAGSYVFQQGGQCLKVDGCLQLSSPGVCLNCTVGYYLSQGLCGPCDPSCASCRDSSICLTCAPGYFNGTDVSYAICQTCSAGCKVCSDAATCSDCMAGYRLNGLACTACPLDCASCSDAITCQQCSAGAVLVGALCYLCTDVSQQGSTGCAACVSSGTRVECTACSPGFYFDPASKACLACSSKFPNSVLCSFDRPLQCLNDAHPTLASRYLLVGSQCVANLNKCKDMADATGRCSSCYFTASYGYYSLAGGVCGLCNVAGCLSYSSSCQCLSCQEGYQFLNNQCNACQTLHCSSCQSTITACQACAVAYGRLSSACQLCQPANCLNCDGDSTACAACNPGYYLSAGNCFGCQTHCLACSSSTRCTSCAPTHYLQSNGRCKSLPSHCVSIDDSTLDLDVGSCKRCEYGYILLDGNCYPCGLSLFNVSLPPLSSISALTTTVLTTTPNSPTNPDCNCSCSRHCFCSSGSDALNNSGKG